MNKKFVLLSFVIFNFIQAMESPSPYESFLETSARYLKKYDREPLALIRPTQDLRNAIINDFPQRIASIQSAIRENQIQNGEFQQKINHVKGEKHTESLAVFERLTTHHDISFNPLDRDNIRRACRELQHIYHPDKRTNGQISAQLNAARDILLEGLEIEPSLSEISEKIAYNVQKNEELRDLLKKTFESNFPALIPLYRSQVTERMRKKKTLQNIFQPQQSLSLDVPSIKHCQWTSPQAILPGYRSKFTRQMVGGLKRLRLMKEIKQQTQSLLDDLNNSVIESGVTTPAFFSIPYNAFFLIDNEKTKTTELPEKLFEELHKIVPSLMQISLICHLDALPESVKLFKNLHALDLAGNNLHTLPEWIIEFPHLKLLNLKDNPLDKKSVQKLLDHLTKKGVQVIL